jgi:phosphoglycolate phosphatase
MSRISRRSLNLFFDLDGTLSDPSEGITRSVQHALECLGRPYPSKSELIRYIGPPLRWTFPRLLDTDDKELVETAIRYYRERYEDVGLFENEVYPGIPELLRQLHDDGYPFIEVYGPELDGRFDEKRELVGFILHQRSLDPRRTVMIGDRASDIESGRAYGTRAIGVTYGFGTLDEITAAKPDQICRNPHELYPAVQGIHG